MDIEEFQQEAHEMAKMTIRFLVADKPELTTMGPEYNQVARDLLERACRFMGTEAPPLDRKL